MGVNGKIWLTFRCKEKSPYVYLVICTTEKNCQEKLVIIHVYEATKMSGKCMQKTFSGEVIVRPRNRLGILSSYIVFLCVYRKQRAKLVCQNVCVMDVFAQ